AGRIAAYRPRRHAILWRPQFACWWPVRARHLATVFPDHPIHRLDVGARRPTYVDPGHLLACRAALLVVRTFGESDRTGRAALLPGARFLRQANPVLKRLAAGACLRANRWLPSGDPPHGELRPHFAAERWRGACHRWLAAAGRAIAALADRHRLTFLGRRIVLTNFPTNP